MKILIAPGAFKHSLSAVDAAKAIQKGLERSGLTGDFLRIPIADGGNGTVDAFLAQGGQRITTPAIDPLGWPITGDFALLDAGKTAVIEMARSSGIELLAQHELNPLRTTTYGTGMLMKNALERGAKRFIIGMGGSATVDGGAGCLQALGARFIDAEGQEVPLGGGRLSQIANMDTSEMDPRWKQVEVLIACDVDNPVLGKKGAAAVFGPQKGASAEDVAILEANLRHFFGLVAAQTGVDVRDLPGSGAAGALAGGLMALLNGRIESGIDLILAHNRFDDHLKDAALVITSEGQMDAQTLHGKGPMGVARRAKTHQIPTIAFVGSLNAEDALFHEAGFQAVIPMMDRPMPLEEALQRAGELVERAALRLGYILQIRTNR